MKICKVKMKLMACFNIEKLCDLLLWPVESSLMSMALDARLKGKKIDKRNLQKSAIQFGKDSAKSKDYEYWTAVFSLYEDVGVGSEICFYLKDTFNPGKDTITSYDDLEKFKEDPPDVIIKQKTSGFLEFELKRYRDELTEDGLFYFIDKKIFKHYGTAYNFFIILQNKPGTQIPSSIFKNLHKRIKNISPKRNLGRICITFNANNQHSIFAHIYPKLSVYKKPFVSGSDQVKSMTKQL